MCCSKAAGDNKVLRIYRLRASGRALTRPALGHITQPSDGKHAGEMKARDTVVTKATACCIHQQPDTLIDDIHYSPRSRFTRDSHIHN
jgi:hypothetical protein